MLAKKLGMTRIFDNNGVHYPVTIVECPEATILKVSSDSKDKVKLASVDVKGKSINKPQLDELKKFSASAKKYMYECKVDDNSVYESGKIITVDNFIVGQYVDVRGKTVGKGFAGGMKRHGFGGLEASHGISVSHRSHGSTGQCQDPGKVFKGKKMAGQMGNVNVTIQNLEIVKVDSTNNLLFIKGALPGKKGTILKIADAVKKNLPNEVPKPAFFKSNSLPDKESDKNIVSKQVVNEKNSETRKEVEKEENKDK